MRKLGGSLISHFRGGDECGVAQWSGSCQKSHEDFASSHQLVVEAFEVHLVPSNQLVFQLLHWSEDHGGCGCARLIASSSLVRSCACCRSSRSSCAWSRSPCGSEVTPSAAQADHGAQWRSCWSSAIAVGHEGTKCCLVLSVLIARLSSSSGVRSATTVGKSETERRHDVTSPKLFHQMFLPHKAT